MLGRLGDAEIEDVLRTATIGRIGCRDGDSVYVVPISFVYEDGCAYGHSVEGRKLNLMRATPEGCFEVEDVHGLSDWRSVVAHGVFEELHGGDARAALDLLATRFAPPGTRPDPGAPAPSHGHSTSTPPVLFRIRLQSTTGRFESTALPLGSAHAVDARGPDRPLPASGGRPTDDNPTSSRAAKPREPRNRESRGSHPGLLQPGLLPPYEC